MRKLTLVYFLLVQGLQGITQPPADLDSLLVALQTSSSDTARIHTAIELAYAYEYESPQIQLRYWNLADSLASQALSRSNAPYMDSLLTSKLWLATLWQGKVYGNMGMLDKYLSFHQECIDLAKRTGDKGDLAVTYNNLAYAYGQLGQTDREIEYYELARGIYKELGDKDGEATILNNLAYMESDAGRQEKAIELYAQSLEFYREVENFEGISNALRNLGTVYLDQGRVDEALEKFQASLEVAESKGLRMYQALAHRSLASVHLENENLDMALMHADSSMTIAKQLDMLRIQVSAKNLESRILGKLRRHEQALTSYQDYIVLRDSLEGLMKKDEIAMEQAREAFEADRISDSLNSAHALEIQRAENDRIQQAKDAADQLTLYTATGAGVVLLLIAAFGVTQYRHSRKQAEHNRVLASKNAEILDSIQYAKRLQNAILPARQLVKEHLTESFILYKPKDIVAGDFYWMQAQNEEVWFAAADCTGHGVPGAMVSVVCANALNRAFKEFELRDPAQILDKVRQLVIDTYTAGGENVKDGMDIALCRLNVKTRQVSYAGANNPLWIVSANEPDYDLPHRDEVLTALRTQTLNGLKLAEIRGDRQPIGAHTHMEDFTSHRLSLSPGDCIYLFSDGYADQFGGDTSSNPHGKKFKYSSLKNMLSSLFHDDMETQSQTLDRVFEDWKGQLEQVDDVCVIGVRV